MSYTKTVLMAAAAFASMVNAHMIMVSPVPYGAATINSSPLDASGSDFPCKQRPGVYDVGDAKNEMAVGAPQTLAFKGGATHGGGSCQVSITKDKNPTKDSKWEVIHSIVGGCPSDGAGNLSEDPDGSGATKFQYTIPKDVAPGEYTLAWTWFNRIGNREMYMNCAPITVTGSKKRSLNETELYTRAAAFPDMFIANIPASDCTTAESQSVDFPNPGPSVEKLASSTGGFAPPTGPKCGAGPGSGTSTSSGSGTGSGTGSGSGSPSGSGSGAPSPVPSNPGGVFAGSPGSTTPSTTPATPAPAPAAPAPAPAAPAPAPAPGAGGCTTPGRSVCSPDGKQIGTCDATNHVVFMAVAPGTVCQGGYMVMAGSTGKRSAKFVRKYIRRADW